MKKPLNQGMPWTGQRDTSPNASAEKATPGECLQNYPDGCTLLPLLIRVELGWLWLLFPYSRHTIHSTTVFQTKAFGTFHLCLQAVTRTVWRSFGLTIRMDWAEIVVFVVTCHTGKGPEHHIHLPSPDCGLPGGGWPGLAKLPLPRLGEIWLNGLIVFLLHKSQAAWIQILALSLCSFVTSGNLLKLSDPYRPWG